ncbi:MAG: CvpA family protein [Lachnospiraceae bacterium]|nr:CvpA family protein [Lachnospiraceae bacterium]
MSNVFLIFTIAVFIISIIIGVRKGILGVVFGVITWVLIIGLIYFGTPFVKESLMKGPIYEKFYNAVYDHVQNGLIAMENENETSAEMADEAIDHAISDPESVGDLFDAIDMDIPWLMMRAISDAANVNDIQKIDIPEGQDEESIDARIEAVSQINATIADTAATPIANMMVKGISVLLVLILSLLLTRILGLIVNALNDAPVIGETSRILGGLWGVLCALLIIWVAMDLVICFAATPRGQSFMNEITSNSFLNALFINNPLEFLVK